MKLTDFEVPVGGSKGSIFSIKSWWQLILGGLVMILTLGISMEFLNRLILYFPALGGYRFTGFRPAAPAPVTAPAPTPAKVLFGVK